MPEASFFHPFVCDGDHSDSTGKILSFFPTMAKVQIADVIVPEVFQRYVIERTATLSQFWRSGIVERRPEFDVLAASAGVTVNMPFWQDLSGDEEVLSDSGSLTPAKIAASRDIAAIHAFGKAWSANDLAGILAGDDPMDAIISLVADWWARVHQGRLIKSLTGVFAAASMSGNVLDIRSTGAAPDEDNWLTGLTFIDAKGKLGDAAGKLVAIAMHSDTERSLRKQALIEDVPGPDGRTIISVFQGLEVIIDDGLPSETLDGYVAYTSYLFGRGAFGYGEATDARPIQGGHGDWYVEMGRSHLAGDTDLVNRRRCILHPRGIKWTSASQASTVCATRAELATAANWIRVFEAKNVRLVKIVHNIGN
jgi:hypothetical protein